MITISIIALIVFFEYRDYSVYKFARKNFITKEQYLKYWLSPKYWFTFSNFDLKD